MGADLRDYSPCNCLLARGECPTSCENKVEVARDVTGSKADLLILDEIEPIKSDGGSTDYYQLPPDATELQDLIEAKNMNFAVGNIFKACFRLGEKEGNDPLYDIRKIKWFAIREEKRLTRG